MPSPPGNGRSNLRSAVDLYSLMNSATFISMICPIHENCGGICTGSQTIVRPDFGSSILNIVPSPQPSPLPANCQNAAWLRSQCSNAFTFSPVDSSHSAIRLSRVHSAIFRDDVLECDLVEVSLDENPVYTALSYYWGPPQFDHQIILNGKVDALYINQQDKPELTSQILLMRRIYSEASSVRVDLGPTDNSWYPGYDLLSRMCLIFQLEEQHFLGLRSSSEQILQSYGLPESTNVVWNAYRYLFEPPWFTWTWTLQEIVLAKEAKFVFGPFSFTWEQLFQSLTLYTRIYPGFAALGTQAATHGKLNVLKIADLITLNLRERSPLAWLYAMRTTRDFKVSDPRDKIIGISGLVDEKPRLLCPQVL